MFVLVYRVAGRKYVSNFTVNEAATAKAIQAAIKGSQLTQLGQLVRSVTAKAS